MDGGMERLQVGSFECYEARCSKVKAAGSSEIYDGHGRIRVDVRRHGMKRREFIKRTVPVSILPVFLGGFTLRAYGRSPILEALVASGTETDHVLVLIQL